MEIKRGNFRFNRIVNVNEILNESALFSMNQDDIDNDAIVNGERLEDGDELIVFQNTKEPYQNERYCYIKFNALVGGDLVTKQITINKIIVDKNLIHPNLFTQIFTILLQQEDNEHPNRIVITNRFNECYRGRIVEIARSAANRVCEIYTYTSDLNPTYIIQ
jgi:hypothetical protein